MILALQSEQSQLQVCISSLALLPSLLVAAGIGLPPRTRSSPHSLVSSFLLASSLLLSFSVFFFFLLESYVTESGLLLSSERHELDLHS